MAATDQPDGVAPYVVDAGEGLLEAPAGVKASRVSTAGRLTVIESVVDGGPPRHSHLYEDETFYVLEGRLDLECGGATFAAAAGSFVFLPRRIPHALRSVDGPARLLIIAVPGGLEEYFAAMHAARGAGADPDELARVRETYGILPA
jgi:quercetin dioxygenase-like cupin family protein